MKTETNADKYYAATFPERLTCHQVGETNTMRVFSESESPDASGTGYIAEIHGEQNMAFVKELCRRWNHSPRRENALMDIKAMAGKRKTCVRMPNGMMLDTFCGQSLLE